MFLLDKNKDMNYYWRIYITIKIEALSFSWLGLNTFVKCAEYVLHNANSTKINIKQNDNFYGALVRQMPKQRSEALHVIHELHFLKKHHRKTRLRFAGESEHVTLFILLIRDGGPNNSCQNEQNGLNKSNKPSHQP